ncbi:hypothetical protein J6590_024537 [Homalodisca vitripennis]|nr:hypothetical protein J6590_024537 [Homalodisca vitripennis]
MTAGPHSELAVRRAKFMTIDFVVFVYSQLLPIRLMTKWSLRAAVASYSLPIVTEVSRKTDFTNHKTPESGTFKQWCEELASLYNHVSNDEFIGSTGKVNPYAYTSSGCTISTQQHDGLAAPAKLTPTPTLHPAVQSLRRSAMMGSLAAPAKLTPTPTLHPAVQSLRRNDEFFGSTGKVNPYAYTSSGCTISTSRQYNSTRQIITSHVSNDGFFGSTGKVNPYAYTSSGCTISTSRQCNSTRQIITSHVSNDGFFGSTGKVNPYAYTSSGCTISTSRQCNSTRKIITSHVSNDGFFGSTGKVNRYAYTSSGCTISTSCQHNSTQ